MKFQKVVFSGLAVLALSTAAITSSAQVDVGLRLGANFNNVTIKNANGNINNNTKILPGINAGLTFDIPVADEFYVQPGALFSTKGYKDQDPDNNDNYTNYSAYYLDVPVTFLYKPVLGDGRLLLGAGPYIGVGLGGKWKDHTAGTTETGKLEFINDWNDESSDPNVITYGKPIDAGANFLFGYEFTRNFSAQLNAQLGVVNLEPDDNGVKPQSKFKNNNFGISVGYKF